MCCLQVAKKFGGDVTKAIRGRLLVGTGLGTKAVALPVTEIVVRP